MLNCGCGSDEGVVVAAESSVVFARLPFVEFAANQRNRHWEAKAAYGFGEGNDVWFDVSGFKAEKCSRSSAAGLDVVNDHHHVVTIANLAQATQPRHRCGVKAAFTLNCF